MSIKQRSRTGDNRLVPTPSESFPTTSAPTARTARSSGGIRILNVEDHEPARFLRTTTLTRAGYTVEEAETAKQARALVIADASVRLALLDIGLPDGDGFQLCQDLKARHSHIRVVMITSTYRSGASRLQGLGAGADEYLLDPVPGPRLVRTLDRVLAPIAAGGPPAVITTDAFGLIVALNEAAGTLLNLSPRAAVGRSLLPFVGGERAKVAKLLSVAADGQFVQEEILFRPRERKPLKLELDLDRPGLDRTVEWTLRRLPEAQHSAPDTPQPRH
jgi:CheY-like chemotaxis protein